MGMVGIVIFVSHELQISETVFDSDHTAESKSEERTSSQVSSDKIAPIADPNAIDLCQFSKESVSQLIEFIYTGLTNVPDSVESRRELWILADWRRQSTNLISNLPKL